MHPTYTGGVILIDNYLLEELVTFKKYGTLAATAEHLRITQPTVTRGMQKIEEEFGVQIFDRKPNKISLTKTGELAAEQAQKVLALNQDMIEAVQKYDYNQHHITVASVAPGPVILLKSILSDLPQQIDINKTLLEPEVALNKLQTNDFSMIITNQEIQTDEVESRYIGTEKLSVNLNKFTYLANKKSVTFKDLKGFSFIVLSDIGVWKKNAEDNIPDAKFLYQNQYEAFTEITKYSDFPYFSTNMSQIDPDRKRADSDEVEIPITGEFSSIDFYATYLKANKKVISPIAEKMTSAWENKVSD